MRSVIVRPEGTKKLYHVMAADFDDARDEVASILPRPKYIIAAYWRHANHANHACSGNKANDRDSIGSV